MDVRVVDVGSPAYMAPVCLRRRLLDCPLAGTTFGQALERRLVAASAGAAPGTSLSVRGDFWPSAAVLTALLAAGDGAAVCDGSGEALAWLSVSGELPFSAKRVPLDTKSIIIRYPWDLLLVNEELVGALAANHIEGVVRDGVTIDGFVQVGAGSVLLPGVYIEGNAVIGRNCKIGPNCYIRGCTSVGDNCHVGQAVEVKNSIFMHKVSAGHLSYVGDSVLCDRVNLGAGTVSANLRHDGKNHRSVVAGELIDTGRRKLGVILGDDVHTGVNTSFYPGRKLWPGCATLPGEVVSQDKA